MNMKMKGLFDYVLPELEEEEKARNE